MRRRGAAAAVTEPPSPATRGLDAVVFDMDGVLIDTEPVWRQVEISVFASLGVRVTEEECRETMGLRIDEVVQLRYAEQPWTGASAEQVGERILDGVVAHVRAHGVAMDGVAEAFAAVRGAGLACAVASSSPRRLISAVLERLGLATRVDVVCSADEEVHGKPAPDVYRSSARLLGVDPAACLAVEDSVNGVLSALAAGMRCAVLPDEVTAADPRLPAAAMRLGSLRELDERFLESLAGSATSRR